MKCALIKPDGTNCGANAMCGSQYCFRHNERAKSEALQASSKGGKARRQYSCLGKLMRIKKPEDIKRLMEQSINKIWVGEMASNNPAGSLGFLAKIFLEAYEKCDLEERLELLEKRLEKFKNDN